MTDLGSIYYRDLRVRFPCTFEKGCQSIDVDRLPALRGMDGSTLSIEPCDNCKTFDLHLNRIR